MTILKLPIFHIQTPLSGLLKRMMILNRFILERLGYYRYEISFGPQLEFIDDLIKNVIDQIYLTSDLTVIQRRFGPNWEEPIRMALYHDILSAQQFALEVKNNRQYPSDSGNWFGQSFIHTIGSHTFLSMYFSKKHTTMHEVPGNTLQFEFQFDERGIFKHVSDNYSSYFKQWEKSAFRDPKMVGIIRFLSENIKGFEVRTPIFPSNPTAYCLGDLIFDHPNPSLSYFDKDTDLMMLFSDGVSHVSMAFNFIFKPYFSYKDTIVGNDIVNLVYSRWSGTPDSLMRSYQLQIWTGIEFIPPSSSRPRGPGNGGGGPRQTPPSAPSEGGGGESPGGFPSIIPPADEYYEQYDTQQPNRPSGGGTPSGGVVSDIARDVSNVAAELAINIAREAIPIVAGQAIRAVFGTNPTGVAAQTILPIALRALTSTGLIPEQQNQQLQISQQSLPQLTYPSSVDVTEIQTPGGMTIRDVSPFNRYPMNRPKLPNVGSQGKTRRKGRGITINR